MHKRAVHNREMPDADNVGWEEHKGHTAEVLPECHTGEKADGAALPAPANQALLQDRGCHTKPCGPV